jgi:hypothetical protein
MAALTPEEKKEMADIMSKYKPEGSIYNKRIQDRDTIWYLTSPSKLAVSVYYEVRPYLTDKSNIGQNQYVYVKYEGPHTNEVLSFIDSSTDWEKLNWLYPMGNQPGDQHDKNLFNRTLYEKMKALASHPLSKITLEDAMEMTETEMLEALAKHELLRKTNEEKGYSWNKPAGDVLREQNPEEWKLLGSPDEEDPTPLRELVGLKDNVRTYLESKFNAAGTGLNAVRTRKVRGARRKRSTRSARKTRRSRK